MANIFIMDDEPNILLVLKEVLSDNGHTITTANNGLAGLTMLRGNLNPDIILLDLKMPDMNGKEVIEEINNDEKLKNIPKVIISGSFLNSEDFPPQNNYHDIISKPFDIFEVVEKIERFV